MSSQNIGFPNKDLQVSASYNPRMSIQKDADEPKKKRSLQKDSDAQKIMSDALFVPIEIQVAEEKSP